MTKTCTICGAATAAEARFCRRCGAPLRAASSAPDEGFVSPKAPTETLNVEPRPTEDLAPGGAVRPGPETGRVGRAELDAFLRQAVSRADSFEAPEPHPDTQIF